MRMRLVATAVLEYEARPEDYETDDPGEIVAIDQETADDDLYLFLDNEDTKWDVKITVIDNA